MTKFIDATVQCGDYEEKIHLRYKIEEQPKFTRVFGEFHGENFVIAHEIRMDDVFITNVFKVVNNDGQEDFYKWDQELLLEDFSLFGLIENELSELIVWHFQYLIKTIIIKISV